MIAHLTAMRQRGRFAGFSLYVSNTTDGYSGYLCYKDGQELPPLDFNTNCLTNGRYVIFYNERLVGTNYPIGYEIGSVFTELCDIRVTGTVLIGRGVFQFPFYILIISNICKNIKFDICHKLKKNLVSENRSTFQKVSIFDTVTLH